MFNAVFCSAVMKIYRYLILGRFMKNIVKFLIISPMAYFIIAVGLTLLPVKRDIPRHALDFSVLQPHEIAKNNVEMVSASYRARDGSLLYYKNFKGNGRLVVVLLHGSGTEGRYLLPLARQLQNKLDVTVIVPDLRGHGRSQNTKPGDIDYLGQYLHDIEDLFDHIKIQHPSSQFIIGGHSSGGGLALKYAGSNLKRFDGLLLMAPYLGYEASTVREDSGGWVQVAKRRYVGLSMLNNVGVTFLNSTPVLFFNRPVEHKDKQLDSYSYRLNQSLAPHDHEADFSVIKEPILLMVGESDEAFFPEAFSPIVEQFASHAQLDIIDGVKHLDLPSHSQAHTVMEAWLNNEFLF